MSETPRTDAGRRLLDSVVLDGGHLYGGTRESLGAAILAIEAEAASEPRPEAPGLREALDAADYRLGQLLGNTDADDPALKAIRKARALLSGTDLSTERSAGLGVERLTTIVSEALEAGWPPYLQDAPPEHLAQARVGLARESRRVAVSEHRVWLGWYDKGVPHCAYCGKSIEPIAVTRGNIVKGWRHR